jgi:hypothetical protein
MALTRLARGKNFLFRFHDYMIIALVVGPFLSYILWVSFLPGYRSWAHAQFTMGTSTETIVVGFSVFWLLAILGIVAAFRDRRLDMLFLCLWSLSTILLLIGFGSLGYKLAEGVVIAYGILGAFGVDYLLHSRALYRVGCWPNGQALLRGLVAITIGLLLIPTSLAAYGRLSRSWRVPRVDTEILAAAATIRQEKPDSIPIVLTGCSTGSVMPGFAGARVYAGHWALTPNFHAKCDELAAAGFDERLGPGFDEQLGFHAFDEQAGPSDSVHGPSPDGIRGMLAEIQPDFVLVSRGTWAEQWLLAHHAALERTVGRRWSLLVVVGFN